ncbi:fimbria/pilus outer membrane usher protein [Buttiauxella agrestis]|uniref:fimbria/pilus outer membrane usher protein n=1 Tax=Buttiauxella agrestis TaxID=82977 RepID=UPI0005553E84|nr:fimbria/pilus outer membrane usher protein [Buttiauxella agrestis]
MSLIIARALVKLVFIRSSLFLSILASISMAQGQAYFDPGMMQSVGGAPAITDLNSVLANQVKEGTYHVYIEVNGKKFATEDIQFSMQKEALIPCIPVEMYAKIGVDSSSHDVNINLDKEDRSCVLLNEAVPVATSSFDYLTKKLSLSFPQTTLRTLLKDEIPPELWDDGIPALLIGYQASGSQTIENKQDSSAGAENYVNFKNGLNLGPWRLRNLSTLSQSSGSGTEVESLSTYVERAIPSLKSELVMGDAYTSGDLFDSIRIKGLQLTSDTEMIPDSINGFSPVIRGVANSNAKVIVRQNNNIIYQTNVAPGPFAISDMAPVSSGGILDITIQEADGSEKHLSQSFSSMSILQRQGSLKYGLSAGKYSEATIKSEEPDVFQATAAYGLPYDVTLLSGIQNTNDYRSYDLGVGLDLGFLGAFSVDVAKENSTLAESHENRSGTAMHLAYSNHMETTRSDINFNYTQYSDRYVSFADNYGTADESKAREKQFTLSINQAVTDTQTIFVSMNQTDYRDSTSSKMYQLGFNSPIGPVSTSLTLSLNQDFDEEGTVTNDKQVMVNFTLPLSVFDKEAKNSASLMMTNDTEGNSNQTLGLHGNIMDSEVFTYNTQLGYNVNKGEEDGRNASITTDYKGSYGEIQMGYNQDENQKQFTYGLNGQLIIHRHGATIGQYSDGALALVSAPGASHVGVKNNLGVYTDWRGYTIVPELSAYDNNSIQIDADSVGANISFENISTNVIPTKDAVVLANFPANIGRKVLFTVSQRGKVIPFGSQASLIDSDRMFFVGDGGQLFITGAPDEGDLSISMDDKQACKAHYKLPVASGKLPITMMKLTCGNS